VSEERDAAPIATPGATPPPPTSLERLRQHRAAHAEADPSRRVWFYHSHAYFDHEAPARVEEARAFMDRIAHELCADGHVEVHGFIPKAVGPHPRGSFEVLFTREAFADYVSWLSFHRPASMSILVHPLTASQMGDHTDRALWLGRPLPMIVDILARSDAANVAAGRSEESIVDGTKKH
jgi:aromatic ring-cleaving dioxygenase